MNVISLLLIFLSLSVGILVSSLKPNERTAISDEADVNKTEQSDGVLKATEKAESELISTETFKFSL